MDVIVEDWYTIVHFDDGGYWRNQSSANRMPVKNNEKVLEELNKCTMEEESIIDIHFVENQINQKYYWIFLTKKVVISL